jgi:hypothetical protein
MSILSRGCWLIAAMACMTVRALAQGGDGIIRGTITDSTSGTAVRRGAQVLVVGTTLGALADDSGHYSLRVPAGFATVEVRRIGYVHVRRDSILVKPGMVTQVDFSLPQAAGDIYVVSVPAQGGDGTIRGTVTDSTSGRRLQGAQIDVPNSSIGSITDDSGRYSLDLPVGLARVIVRRIGYFPVTRDSIRVEPGKVTQVDFVLERDPRPLSIP